MGEFPIGGGGGRGMENFTGGGGGGGGGGGFVGGGGGRGGGGLVCGIFYLVVGTWRGVILTIWTFFIKTNINILYIL